MGFKMPRPGKSYSPPDGVYKMGGPNPSRFTGTDIDGEVFQTPRTKKWYENYDRTFRKKKSQP